MVKKVAKKKATRGATTKPLIRKQRSLAKPRKLTAKQERFVEEYLVDFNATQAAVRSGYSKKTARVIGQENLLKPAIAKSIADHRASLTQKTELTREMIVEGLKHEARYTGKNASHGARVAAWTQLGRIEGIYEEDNIQKNRLDVGELIARMPPEIREALLNERTVH